MKIDPAIYELIWHERNSKWLLDGWIFSENRREGTREILLFASIDKTSTARAEDDSRRREHNRGIQRGYTDFVRQGYVGSSVKTHALWPKGFQMSLSVQLSAHSSIQFRFQDKNTHISWGGSCFFVFFSFFRSSFSIFVVEMSLWVIRIWLCFYLSCHLAVTCLRGTLL